MFFPLCLVYDAAGPLIGLGGKEAIEMASKRRDGFTLVELMVVVGIVAVLVGLTLPAVQAAREASRRLGCVGNLRQIGIGMAAYESTFGVLPRGTPDGLSAHAHLLPYLDQQPLADLIDETRHPAGTAADARGTSLAIFLCPSDLGWSRGGGCTNYAASQGRYYPRFGPDGAFAVSTLGSADFTDGMSNTSTFSEWAISPAAPRRVPNATGFLVEPPRGSPRDVNTLEGFLAKCAAIDPTTSPIFTDNKGRHWAEKGPGSTEYNHALPINQSSCSYGTSYTGGVWTAGSRHPGGAHTLLADGRARFVRDSLTLEVWRALGSRNGGEVFSTP